MFVHTDGSDNGAWLRDKARPPKLSSLSENASQAQLSNSQTHPEETSSCVFVKHSIFV
jgi:hypothetical protein